MAAAPTALSALTLTQPPRVRPGPVLQGPFFTLDLTRPHCHVLTLDTRQGSPSDAEWDALERTFVQSYARKRRFVWIIDTRNFNLDIFAERIISVYETVHPLRHWSRWLCAGTVVLTNPDQFDLLHMLLQRVPTKSQLEVVRSCAELNEAAARMIRTHIYMRPAAKAAPHDGRLAVRAAGMLDAVLRMREAVVLPGFVG